MSTVDATIINIDDEDSDDLYAEQFREEEENKEEMLVKEDLFIKYVPPILPDNNFTVNNKLIYLKRTDILRLIYQFEPTYDNFDKAIKYCFKSPLDKELVKIIVIDWYTQNPDNSEQTIEDFADNYYIFTRTNEWIFRIINQLPEKRIPIIYEKYFNNVIDDSGRLDDSDDLFTINQLKHKKYNKASGTGIRVGNVMSDLKRCVAIIESSDTFYVIKVNSSAYRKPELIFTNESNFKSKLKKIKVGFIIVKEKVVEINALKIIEESNNVDFITYDQFYFFLPNPSSNTFCFFRGYEYDLIDDPDFRKIKLFIDHIHNIICSGNVHIYNYIIQWLAYLFRFPNAKLSTAIVLTGMQGSGKNTFTKTICKLLGPYANDNADLNHLIGEHNSSVLHKKLFICNEAKAFKSNRVFDDNKLKTLITEDSIDVNPKFRNVIHQENISNFIILSNNFAPLKLDKDDRRFLVCDVSPISKRIEKVYFDNLTKSFTDEFYSTFLTYLASIDVSNWNRFEIPMTDAKRALIDYSQNPITDFIQESVSVFIHGITPMDAQTSYKKWCSKSCISPKKPEEVRTGILQYCKISRDVEKNNPAKPRYYILKKSWYSFFGIEEEIIEVNSDDSE